MSPDWREIESATVLPLNEWLDLLMPDGSVEIGKWIRRGSIRGNTVECMLLKNGDEVGFYTATHFRRRPATTE